MRRRGVGLGEIKSVMPGESPLSYAPCLEGGAIYVSRFIIQVPGVNDQVVKTSSDMRSIVQAFGRAQDYGWQVIGATVFGQVGNTAFVDVVGTPVSSDPPCFLRTTPWENQAGVIERMTPDLAARWPGIVLSPLGNFQITGPATVVTEWRAKPVLWDLRLGDKPCTGVCDPKAGGPTSAFATTSGLYWGGPADAPGLKSWQDATPPKLGGGTPATPPAPPIVVPGLPPVPAAPAGVPLVWWGAGIALAVGAWWWLRRRPAPSAYDLGRSAEQGAG